MSSQFSSAETLNEQFMTTTKAKPAATNLTANSLLMYQSSGDCSGLLATCLLSYRKGSAGIRVQPHLLP
jgi:hypothetical protein